MKLIGDSDYKKMGLSGISLYNQPFTRYSTDPHLICG